jgi:hypothetical protein
MQKIECFDPSGIVPATRKHAPRLDSLNGKKIGFVSIDEWQAYRTFPRLRQLLTDDFEGVQLMPMDAYPRGIGPISTEEAADVVARSGVDAVVVGNAA